MRWLLVLLMICGCSAPSVTLAPGDHYHCNEGLIESLGELKSALGRAESLCSSIGGYEDES